jgi:colicin import membrane protein
MGKNSLIKSTTKKKPATEKEDNTKQAQKISAGAKKSTRPKSSAKPVAKTAQAKKPAKKQSAVKVETTTTDKKKAASKVTAQTPARQPAKAPIEKKPLPKEATPYPHTPASTDHIPPAATKPADPAEKMLYYGVAGFVLLVLIVVIASWMNTHHYYVKPGKNAVDIWQGKFAPKGARHLISFPGLKLAEPIKDTYAAKEIFPIIYQYYLDKADMLLEVPGVPDFDGVKAYLHKSQDYAATQEMKAVIKSRLDAINLMVLLYKADVAASKNSPEDLKAAMGYLKEALSFQMDELESTRIQQKADAVKMKLEGLNSAPAKTAEGDNDKKKP